jgi:hypothetical protein
MRPFISYQEQGAEAFFDASSRGKSPYPDGTLASLEWMQGYKLQLLEAHDLDEDVVDELRLEIDDLRRSIFTHCRLASKELPTVTAISDAIRVPADKWPNNCYEISVRALESGVLDAFQAKYGPLIPTYGMYEGPTEKRGVFARHGWLESQSGFVVDCTRWVFTNDYPAIWLGGIGEYDLGANRLRSRFREGVPEPDEYRIRLGINDKEILNAFDRMLGGDSVKKTGEISRNQLHWIMTSPLEMMGKEASLFIKTAQRTGNAGLIPVDTLLWYEFSENGYDPLKLRKVVGTSIPLAENQVVEEGPEAQFKPFG